MAVPPTLLALRALGLGDLLVAVPALRGLRRAFPEHRLLLAVPRWLHPLGRLVGGWDELLPVAGLDDALPPGLPPVEVAVNLHGNGAGSAALLESVTPRRRIGHRRPGWPGPVWVDELPERRRWCRMLAAHGIAADEADLRLPRPDTASSAPGAVLVHPGAAYGAKCWPVSRFAAVATALRAAGHHVLVTGGARERSLAERLAGLAELPASSVLAGRTDIAELAAVVASARAVISGDTGIAHLAAAFGTPTITLYGPVDAQRWAPPSGGPHRGLHVGRHRRGDPFADDPDPALLAVSVTDVLAAGSDLGLLASQPDERSVTKTPAQ